VVCGVLKPSAQQQGVQEQRQGGVLSGPRCRKESRQPTHAAWSSASAACIMACIIHHDHGHLLQMHVESPGFDKILPHSQGEFDKVQIDIQQPYVHCTKKVREYRYPLYFENFKNRVDSAWLIRPGIIS
jgi:hypothetical protein